jgi:MFS family permease
MNEPENRSIPASARAVLLGASTMTVMAGAMIAPGLPGMERAFQQVPEIKLWVGIVLSSPAIAIAVAGVGMGWLVERAGARDVLAGSLILFGLAGSAGLWLDSLEAIIASRVILGVAVGGIMTAATTLIAECFSGLERQSFMGIQASFMGLGGVVFLVIGGVLSVFGWRGPFAVYLAGLLLAPLVIRLLPRVGCAASEGADASNDEPTPWLEVSAILVVAFLGLLFFFVIPVQVPFRIEAASGGGSLVTGVVLALFNLFAASAASQYRRVRGWIGRRAVAVGLFLLVALGFSILAMTTRVTGTVVGLVVSGVGFGFLFPFLTVGMTDVAPARMRGRLVGALTAAIYLGQFLSPFAFRPIVAAEGRTAAFWVAAGAALVLALLCGVVARRR